MIARAIIAWALVLSASLGMGCLGEAEERSCADFPREAVGCEEYWAARAEAGVEPADASEVDADPADAAQPDLALADSGQPDLDAPDRDPDSEPSDMMAPTDGGAEDQAVDMLTDAEPPCTGGTERPCGSGDGECVQGREFCGPDGFWTGECIGEVGPTDEICDGLDNDCDGVLDPGCECLLGETRGCGSNEGICVGGEQPCVDGRWAGECAVEAGPRPEQCNGLDDDCDGTVDNPPGIGQPCFAGVGACRAEGTLVCLAIDPGAPQCDARPLEGRLEFCNAIDDDCDGTTDEGQAPRFANTSVGTMAGPRAAIAPSIEFHGIMWIDPDDAVHFGLFIGEDPEVDPFIIPGFGGGDTVAQGVDLAPARVDNGFVYAISYGDVGGTGIAMGRMRQGGVLIEPPTIIDADASARISVTGTSEGPAVAWVEQTGRATSAIGIAAPGIEPTILERNRLDGQPSLAAAGNHLGLAFVQRSEPGGDGPLYFRSSRAIGDVLGLPVLITRSARDPDLVWVEALGRFALAYTDTSANRVRVTLIDNRDRVTHLDPVLGQVNAGRAALAPIEDWARQDRVRQLAVAFRDRDVGGREFVMVNWLLLEDDVWQLSPVRTQAFGSAFEQYPTAAFASDGEGLGIIANDPLRQNVSRVRYLSGRFGCPTGPAPQQ